MTTSTFPALDRSIVIDFGHDGPFGPFAAELAFSSATETVTFVVTRGSMRGKTETLPFTAVPITDGIWLVSWQEADLLTVVQVQDFTSGRLVSAVTTADQQLATLHGTLQLG